MNNEKLSSLQFSCLTCFPMLALFNGIGTHNTIKIAQIDSYISVFMAFLLNAIKNIKNDPVAMSKLTQKKEDKK